MHVFEKLLNWYKKHGRDLPWRNTRDPYKILVSEIMLQQTQVVRVIDFYRAWMKRFPTWKHLAGASNKDVIEAWAGLGYNRRGLMLRDIARIVVEHGVPTSETEWRALKGIGPYTAAALTSFSLHEPTMPVDTNIRRVLGRVFYGVTYPQPRIDDTLKRRAERELAHTTTPHDVPQALFDLATSTCTKIPDCATCPLQTECRASEKFLSGKFRIPKQMVKKPTESRHRNKKHPDRIYRGRILKLVRESHTPVSIDSIGPKIDTEFNQKLDKNWLEQMVHRLVHDKLLSKEGSRLTLSID